MLHKRTLKIFYLDLRCLLPSLLWRHFWGIVRDPRLDTKTWFWIDFPKKWILIGEKMLKLNFDSTFRKSHCCYQVPCTILTWFNHKIASKIKDRSTRIWCKIWQAEKQPNSKLRIWFWSHFKHWQIFSQNIFQTVRN